MPFHGIKEDISFLGHDVAGIAPYQLPGDNKGLVRVLFRPPAEESHYHREESSLIAQELLRELACQSPRSGRVFAEVRMAAG